MKALKERFDARRAREICRTTWHRTVVNVDVDGALWSKENETKQRGDENDQRAFTMFKIRKHCSGSTIGIQPHSVVCGGRGRAREDCLG